MERKFFEKKKIKSKFIKTEKKIQKRSKREIYKKVLARERRKNYRAKIKTYPSIY